MTSCSAIYFDGHVAADRVVEVDVTDLALSFAGVDIPRQDWPLTALRAVESPAPGRPLRITAEVAPAARLVIADEAAKSAILVSCPQLHGGLDRRRVGRFFMWLAAGAAAVFAGLWLVVQYAPQQLAFMLPDKWRDRAGAQIERSLVEGAKLCQTDAADRAISAMLARLVEGNPDIPPVGIRIYDIPVMNAFAMPGGRILITSELIKRATEPEEVAGVLAHELGHVSYRHSEAQLVRAASIQVLFAIITGGGGGDTFSQLAGLAAILKYSREAEGDADSFALTTMEHASIDPMGLKHFFELVLAEEKSNGGKTKFGNIQSIFATHPGTEERIAKIKPLPEGITARPVMTADQFHDLKTACAKP